MKRLLLLLLTVGTFFASCDKQVKQPLNYNVTNDILQNGVFDVYLPDTGTYDMAVLVKFLSGYVGDKVTLTMGSMPENVTVSPTTFTGAPTYTEHFVFSTTHATLGKHQITLTTSSPGLLDKVFNFNLIVIPANCATLFSGTISATSTCKVGYTYYATGIVSDTSNILYINNFGGYGPGVTAQVYLDCEKNNVTIPKQVVGNGTTLQGGGTFTTGALVINYTAVSTPGGPADSCTVTFTK